MENVWILKIGGYYDCNPTTKVFSDFFKASKCLETEYEALRREHPDYLERFNSKYSKILMKPKTENGKSDGFILSINEFDVL